jgi:hypothetical protein
LARRPFAFVSEGMMEAAMATTIVKSKPRAKATRKAAPKMAARRPTKKWSQDVTEHSNALDLQRDVFKLDDPKKIAASLKRSAERSHRRKAAPYRSAMSMLTFYVNRAGHTLGAKRKRVLERAKDELRKAFGKDA